MCILPLVIVVIGGGGLIVVGGDRVIAAAVATVAVIGLFSIFLKGRYIAKQSSTRSSSQL